MDAGLQLMVYRILMAAIGLVLFAAGIVDIRRRQIGRVQLLILLLLCCAVIPLKKEFGVVDAQIGRGDGIVIAAVGIALGARKCLLVVFAASFVMCIAAIVILVFRKGGRQTRLPFLPAVFAGYLLCVML